VACLVQDELGFVLLGRRTDAGKLWALPGGKIERGETEEAAAVRELYEETGIIAEALDRGFIPPVLVHQKNQWWHVPVYLEPFASTLTQDQWPDERHAGNRPVPRPTAEMDAFGWFHPRGLPKDLHPFSTRVLAELFRDQRI
jgi:8-oxo-dGTP pyrophosphatase MutT (NUDIX family)